IINKIEVFVPEEDEQQEIVNAIFSVDDLVEKYEMKIKSLSEYKKGLMQRLFPELAGVGV
ncbi:restriction endonuclease subunit S, partial [Vibrio vulnificus]|nr:restriction endonuclease subunit S [Vibrio vulnificus]